MTFADLAIGDVFTTKAWKTREFRKIKTRLAKKKNCSSCGKRVNAEDVKTGEVLFLATHITVYKR